jgi:hypothetical protein
VFRAAKNAIEDALMPNDDLRKFARDGKAAVAAGLAGLLLVGVAVWSVAAGRAEVIEGAVCGGICVALFCSSLGVLGTSLRSLNRASLAGAIIIGVPAAILILLFWREIDRGIWLFAAACSFGSIIAQIGAWAGGSLADRNVSPQRKQFTLRQMLAFFIPVAIFLGYVTHFHRR